MSSTPAVTAVEAGTQLKYTTKTNASGEFLLAQLPVGTVQPHGERARDSSRLRSPNIELHAGDHLRQAFTLELGEQSETLTVSVAPGLLQVESAAIQDTIQQQQVIDLPLKGRDFIDLVGLTPGVTTPPAGTRGSALQQTGQTYGILGQRGGHNLYLVDGVSVTDEAFNNLVLSPSVDDVQEVNINQTSYDAEFGGKSGGVINVITKSGSNRFHGSVFEFVRNDIFDAKNFFVSPTPPKPPFQAKSIRRVDRRPDSEGQNIFLRRLRGRANPPVSNPAVQRSDRSGTRPATSRDRALRSTIRRQERHIRERYDPDDRPRRSRHAGENSLADPGPDRAATI